MQVMTSLPLTGEKPTAKLLRNSCQTIRRFCLINSKAITESGPEKYQKMMKLLLMNKKEASKLRHTQCYKKNKSLHKKYQAMWNSVWEIISDGRARLQEISGDEEILFEEREGDCSVSLQKMRDNEEPLSEENKGDYSITPQKMAGNENFNSSNNTLTTRFGHKQCCTTTTTTSRLLTKQTLDVFRQGSLSSTLQIPF